MTSLISSLEIINVVTESVSGAPGVNPNSIKALLANGLSTFFIKVNLVFSNVLKSLPKSNPDFLNLCNIVFDNLMLAEELFVEVLRNLCIS